MAVNYSPSIVRSGLVLHLDAANRKSYSGSGTSWNDISGSGNNGTLLNDVGYNSSNKGIMIFDGTNDYCNIANTSIGNFATSDFSVSCWAKAASSADTTRGLFSKYDPHSGNGTGWFIFYRDGIIWVRITQDLAAPLEMSQIIVSVPTSVWYNITITRTANYFSLYINGVLYQTNTTTNIINCSSAGPLRIGSGYSSGYYYIGDVGAASIYNRALTPLEIRQNFNALRGRYGI
jgi:hypothetical protein